GRNVPPPAIVEAERGEAAELDRDDDDDRPAVEPAAVVGRDALVEAELERQVPGERDQHRVDGDLPGAVPVERRPHYEIGVATASRATATIRSCVSGSIPAQIGSATLSAAALSVS